MPISGVVVTLDRDHATCAAALAELRAFSALELGEHAAGRLAAVLEADDYATHDARLVALRAVRGVVWVDVVFHDFSDLRDFERPPRGSRPDLCSDDGGAHGAA
jgi:nitrate reductase NapAB chaperone NapD